MPSEAGPLWYPSKSVRLFCEVGSGSPGSSGSGPLFAPAALGPFSLSSCTAMNRPRTYMYDWNVLPATAGDLFSPSSSSSSSMTTTTSSMQPAAAMVGA
eukprot:CAMPEP_0119477690 /NCGR_PEP_ID=MMETSP1344-20130328/7749_1 /TAXON_ID=236787 /ORGANISM="Florenciella parvula, Strain CCMP2471" /LENGTH=98 /DNA_ID=CAMNT_0007511763 /DNA_START=772 /DNA_END=1068 /DNA_ORIENTATION=-